MSERPTRGRFRTLMLGSGEPLPPRAPMTRGEQTLWIVGVMIFLAFLAWRYVETKDTPCAKFPFGTDAGCEAAAAARRISRGFDPYR